jgi:hypothetical protein
MRTLRSQGITEETGNENNMAAGWPEGWKEANYY